MKNRIDEKTSRTAEMTCSFRAASFFEKDPCLKSNDYIAPQLLPRIMLPMVKSRTVRKVFMNTFAPQGIYEYVIARTKYIDEIITEALQNGFKQVLLLGAGFDSRAIRFHALNPETVFFEVDTEIIQAAKESQLQKRNISLP